MKTAKRIYEDQDRKWMIWEARSAMGEFLCVRLRGGQIYSAPLDKGLKLWELIMEAKAVENSDAWTQLNQEMDEVIVDPNEILTGDMDR